MARLPAGSSAPVARLRAARSATARQAAAADLWRRHLSQQDASYEVWDERAEEVAEGAADRVIDP